MLIKAFPCFSKTQQEEMHPIQPPFARPRFLHGPQAEIREDIMLLIFSMISKYIIYIVEPSDAIDVCLSFHIACLMLSLTVN